MSGTLSSAFQAASRALSVRPASPTMAMSTATFLLMLAGSISAWILMLPGLNAFSRPVTRSSNRAPIFSMTSQSCMGQVGLVGAVHAEHAEELRIAGGAGAEAHQRAGARKTGGAHELGQQCRGSGTGVDNTAAAIDHRPLRALQGRDGTRDGGGIGLGDRSVAAMRRIRRRRVGRRRDQDVLRQIDHHGTGRPLRAT